MEAFWKAAAVLILAVILGATFEKTEKDLSILLTLAACCIVLTAAVRYFSDVVVFLWELGSGAGYPNGVLERILKISGVALMTEITEMISQDAGKNTLSKAMQFLGNAAILFLSLPLFETFLTVIQEIMGIP